jgi:hypothetical protein
MKNQEAKFILGAYRPDGRDANDPALATALQQAEHDPELRGWFEKQRKFDAALGDKLQTIAPPPGLREAILAGARMSATPTKRPWWSNPVWLAAAAAIVLTAVLTTTLRNSAGRPTGTELAEFALRDLAGAHDQHVGHPPELAAVQAQLASVSLPLSSNLKLDLNELTKNKCRVITLGGRRIFEVCFQREGTWYHVYVARRSDFAPGALDPKALMKVQGEYASTTWADANNVYALVTHAGEQALRRII